MSMIKVARYESWIWLAATMVCLVAEKYETAFAMFMAYTAWSVLHCYMRFLKERDE